MAIEVNKVNLKELKEIAKTPDQLSSGHRLCPGCAAGTIFRQVLAAAEHPHIVRIYTYGKYEGKAYFVMEYIEGESLEHRLKKQGKLPPEQALKILKQVALALEDAWERKIIHRDIKPSNILIDKKEQVKLADFGMAKSTKIKGEKTLTSPIVFLGSPYYVSPERAGASSICSTPRSTPGPRRPWISLFRSGSS